MKRIKFTVAALLVAGHLNAGHSNPGTDWAKVTGVTPIYDDVAYYEPVEICRDETVHSRQSHTGTILGAVIGGAIGNELGHHKSNQKVGAVVGAILGASIATDIGHGHHPPRYERVCEVVDERKWRREVVAYTVRYRYRGREYSTTMDYDPGDKIKVEVDVRPLS